jgi:hypothetical protein
VILPANFQPKKYDFNFQPMQRSFHGKKQLPKFAGFGVGDLQTSILGDLAIWC